MIDVADPRLLSQSPEANPTMPLVLRWRSAFSFPVDGAVIQPELLAGSSTAAAQLPVRIGNQLATLGDLFQCEGEGGDGQILIEGDLRTVHGLGAEMKSGRMEIRGDVGHRLGERLAGGAIEVFGSVGPAAGAEMGGGMIRVRGRAGAELGAALPGSRVGMRGGVLLVDGDAGAGVGTALRRGLIAVAGAVGPGAGRGMIAGSIFVGGTVGPGVASGMKRGTVGLWGPLDATFDPGPTFEPSGSLRPPVAAIIAQQLREWGFPVPAAASFGSFRRYNGDLSCGGQGEIWQFGPTE